jgi:hypothetical protein
VAIELAHVASSDERADGPSPQKYIFADRELALFKVIAHHGLKRSEVLELCTIFRAKVVDVGPQGLSIALSGDPGKIFAFEQALRPFGLAQLSRTGKITLHKSDVFLDMPGSSSYSPDLRPTLETAKSQAGVLHA